MEIGYLLTSHESSLLSSPNGSTFISNSKPKNIPIFQFDNTESCTIKTVTPKLTSTIVSTFRSSSKTSTLSIKPTTTESEEPSQSSALNEKPILGLKEASKDETDYGSSSHAISNKRITVLENILLTNGPNSIISIGKEMGQELMKSKTGDTLSEVQGQSNIDQADSGILTNNPVTAISSNEPFVFGPRFGQPQNTSNTFSAIASSTAIYVQQESSTLSTTQNQEPKLTFASGIKPTTSEFLTTKQIFGDSNAAIKPFLFIANNTAATRASSPFREADLAPALYTPTSVFDSTAASSESSLMPMLNGLKAKRSSVFDFGKPSSNSALNIQVGTHFYIFEGKMFVS